MQDDEHVIGSEGAARGDARAHAAVAHAAVTPARRVASADLFAGSREIEIEHNGRHYRLRITQAGKLILTA